jgi:hypothetical protein
MRRALILVTLLLAASPLLAASMIKKLVVTTTGESSWNGHCPHQFDFEAEVTSRQQGNVLVQWIRSDGATGTATTLHFGAPNVMLKVTDHWVLSKKYHGWEQLRVTDAAGNVSLSKRAAFSISCR